MYCRSFVMPGQDYMGFSQPTVKNWPRKDKDTEGEKAEAESP
jgi:hypothetical protein